MGVGVGWGGHFIIIRKGVPPRGRCGHPSEVCDPVQTLKDSWIPKGPNNSWGLYFNWDFTVIYWKNVFSTRRGREECLSPPPPRPPCLQAAWQRATFHPHPQVPGAHVCDSRGRDLSPGDITKESPWALTDSTDVSHLCRVQHTTATGNSFFLLDTLTYFCKHSIYCTHSITIRWKKI